MADPTTPDAQDTTAEASKDAPQPAPRLLEMTEGKPTGTYVELDPAQRRARSRRNVAIALGVVGFVILVYSTTLFRIQQNIGTQEGGPVFSDERS